MKKLLLITLLLPLGLVGQTLEELAKANLEPVWGYDEENTSNQKEERVSRKSYNVRTSDDTNYDYDYGTSRTVIVKEDKLKPLLESIDRVMNSRERKRTKTIIIKKQ